MIGRIWVPIAITTAVLWGLSRTERTHRGGVITPSVPASLPNLGARAVVGDQVVLRFDRPTDLQELGVPAQFVVAIFLTVLDANAQTVSGPIVAYTTEGVDLLTQVIDLRQRGHLSQDVETPGTRFLSTPSDPITVSRRAVHAVYRRGQKVS